MSNDPRPLRVGAALLALGLLAACLIDAVMLANVTGYFGGGYNSPRLTGAWAWSGFLVGGALLDAFVLGAAFGVAHEVGAVLRLAGAARLAFAGALALLVPAGMDVVSRQIHLVLGQMVGFDLMVEMAGGRLSDAALFGVSEAPWIVLGLVGAAVGVWLAVALGRRLDHRLAPRPVVGPTRRAIATVTLMAGAGGALALSAADTASPTVAYGLDAKAAGTLTRGLVELATDWDRDGFGWLSRPGDPAAFDPKRHPAAIEIPGNGVDENGLGGDLPAAWRGAPTTAVPSAARGPHPPLLLVFLESFRGDTLGAQLGGQPVTPVLDALAAEGASTPRAYAHNPLTWLSRGALFQGRVAPVEGAPTLIDDLHARGYRVAYVSGQDETHGRDGLVGWERAEHFVDARTHAGERTSRTSLAVSLQVSADRVLEEVERYLAESAEDPRPLFLYVNLVDNHFPYHHDGLARILGVNPVTRAEIRPWNAERVRSTYLQAAANVDAAIGQLLATWRRHFGAAPVLVTADHGQAFYEEGMLGHGQSVSAGQTRVPLVATGLGGRWPEPVGLADLRGLILLGLESPGPGPYFAMDQDRRIFQFTGLLDTPRSIALRSGSGLTLVELARERAVHRDEAGNDTPLDPDGPAAREVIWAWEALRARASAAAPRP